METKELQRYKGLVKEVLNLNKDIDMIYYEEDYREVTCTTFADLTEGVRTYDTNISELKDKTKRWSIEQGYDIDEQPYGSQVVNLQTGDIEFGSLEKDRPKMKEEKSWYKPEHVFACGRYVLDKIRGNKKLEENK